MATVTSSVHLSDQDEPTVRLFDTYPGHFGVHVGSKQGSPYALTLFGTLDQLDDLARQLERLVILTRHDQEEDQVSLTAAGEAALEELGAASEPGGVEDFARRPRTL